MVKINTYIVQLKEPMHQIALDLESFHKKQFEIKEEYGLSTAAIQYAKKLATTYNKEVQISKLIYNIIPEEKTYTAVKWEAK